MFFKNKFSKEELKNRGIFRLRNSFSYAKDGLKYAYLHEQSVWLYIPTALIVILSSIFFEISKTEWIIVILLLGLVYALEIINTAIEKTVDLATNKKHPLAKAAKDLASAAVLIMALTASIIGFIIFIPKIITFIGTLI